MIEKLERELARSHQANTEWQRFAHDLELDLAVARRPQDLVATVQQLLVGSPRSREAVAACWSKLGHYRRRDSWPIVAAAVTDYIDQSVASLPISERSIDEQLAVLGRVRWLAEALTLDPVSEKSTPRTGQGGNIGPVWAAYRAAAQELQTSVDVLEELEKRRSARRAAAGWIDV